MKKRIVFSFIISLTVLLSIGATAHAFLGNARPLPAQEDTTDNEVNLNAGEVHHSIPLQVPPGTNGLAPQLSLEYHGSNANVMGTAFTNGNLFGIGWSMDFPYIYRDTNYTPADTSDDKYKIDWQGTSYDLVDQGSGKFKTNIETFTNITHATGSPNNASGDYWTVQTTDGTTYRFGYNSNSEVACSNRSFQLEWVIDDVTDTHGNNIYYNYAQNPNSNDIGAIYPTTIKYNNDQSRVITFTLDTSDAQAQAQTYYQGCLVRYARNVKTITTSVGGSQVRKYTLNFSNTVSRTMLSSFTEAGSDNTSLPSSSFQYYPQSTQWTTINTKWASPGWDFRDNNTDLYDVNGDGLVDLVHANSSGFYVYLNNGTSFADNAHAQLWASPGWDMFNSRIVDVNKDGLPDLIHADNTGIYVRLNNGSGWADNAHAQLWASPGWDFNDHNTDLYDVNGDGLPDLVHANSSGFYVYLNNGSGWADNAHAQLWASPGWDMFNSRIVDVNGDGLPDLVHADNSGIYVRLNDGSSWADNSHAQLWASPGWDFNDGNTLITDVNGDGMGDLIHADSTGFYIYLYNGNTFAPNSQAQKWASPGWDYNDKNTRIVDVNGDGLADLVHADSTGIYVYGNNNGVSPDLLSSITTAKGGTLSFNYVPSTGFDNTGGDGQSDLPFPVWVVQKKTVNNGLSNSQGTNDITTYSYKNGLFSWPKREFRGFGEVDETDPNGAKKQTFFKQDDGLKGTMYDQKITDGSGNLYAETQDTWNSSASAGVYTNTLASEKKYSYDGSSSNPKINETDYQYDQYGNVTKESDLGDTSTSNDDRFIHKQYTYNTSSYIVNLPYDTYINKADDSTKVGETWDYYDNNINLTDAPTKGDVTKEVKWLSGGTNPTTTYTYDSYGNQTQVTDANSHSTSYTYDSTGTNQTSTTNAKSQTTNTSYDLGTGNLLSKTDPNGFTTSYTYDPFGRVKTEVDPYDSSSFPTKVYTYYDNSTAPQGSLVSQRTVSGQSGTLDAYAFVDGFGRKIQIRKPAEDTSKQIVVDTYYDPNGKVGKESVPHLDTLSTTYAAPVGGIENTITTYDPIARVTQITNPQGTTRTTSYDHWSRIDTDENGHQKKKVMDAFNNIVEVDEYNNGQTYTTTYAYDPLNDLTKITDANSNNFTFIYDTLKRRVSMTDPDMGTWNYTYDGAGNALTTTDNRGKTTTKTYDQLNRLATVSYPTDTGITYTYDGNSKIGTLTSVTDPAGTVSYQYDNRLRKTQEQRVTDGITWTTSYTYDAANRILTTTKPDNEVVTNTYNSQGEVASVSGVLNAIDYNPLDKVVDKTFNNGQTTNYTYNTNDFRLNRIQTGTIQDIGYTYDNVGNVKTTTNNLLSKVQTFGYDSLDRLTAASESAGYNYTYAYDPIGNMTSASSPDTTTTYTYGSSTLVHTPATVTSTTIIYEDALANGWTDASFNTTNSTTTTNVYSGSNALSSTIGANGGLDFQAPRFFNTGGYSYVHFALKASQSGQQYKVYADTVFGQALTTPVSLANYGGQPTTSGWTVYNIPLADLAATNVTLGDLVIQNATGSNEPAVYADQVKLMSGTAPTPMPTATPTPTPQSSSQVVYDEGLSSGWQDWSWSSTNNFSDTSHPNTGSQDISWTVTSGYGGLYLNKPGGTDTTGYTSLTFAVRGSQTGQQLQVALYDNTDARIGNPVSLSNYGGQPTNGSYKTYTIPLSDLSGTNRIIDGIMIQDASGNSQPAIYIDTLELLGSGVPPTATPTPISNFSIYDEGLSSGWQDWSWSSGNNLSDTSHPNTGSEDISWTVNSGWAGFNLHTNGVDTTGYTNLTFALRASQSGQSVQVYFYDSNGILTPLSLTNYGGNPTSSGYKTYTIPLSDLNASNHVINGLVIQDTSGTSEPPMYIDSVALTGGTQSPTPTPTPSMTTVYDEGLSSGWQDWSWSATNNLSDTTHPNTGSEDISWTVNSGWAGFNLHNNGFDTTGYTHFTFALRASQSGQSVQVYFYDANGIIAGLSSLANYGGNPVTSGYTTYSIPISDINATNHVINGLVIQDTSGTSEPPMYIDDIGFTN